jgi:GR25 family glycosyltransferase involved in LPS biosynthesis
MAADINAIFDCWVLNLARTPERLKWFREQNAGVEVSIERFDAIDGSTLDPRAVVANGIVAAGSRFTPGAVGNAMSHRAIWSESLARQRPALVFEDDAVLRHDIGAVLPRLVSQVQDNWDIVLLGYNTDSVIELKLWEGGIHLRAAFSVAAPTAAHLTAFAASREPVELFKLSRAFGCCGYAISPRGAEKLLSKCFPMDNRVLPIPALGRSITLSAIDGMLNAFFDSISAYACFTPLVMPINDRASSSVQPREGMRAGV